MNCTLGRCLLCKQDRNVARRRATETMAAISRGELVLYSNLYVYRRV